MGSVQFYRNFLCFLLWMDHFSSFNSWRLHLDFESLEFSGGCFVSIFSVIFFFGNVWLVWMVLISWMMTRQSHGKWLNTCGFGVQTTELLTCCEAHMRLGSPSFQSKLWSVSYFHLFQSFRLIDRNHIQAEVWKQLSWGRRGPTLHSFSIIAIASSHLMFRVSHILLLTHWVGWIGLRSFFFFFFGSSFHSSFSPWISHRILIWTCLEEKVEGKMKRTRMIFCWHWW